MPDMFYFLVGVGIGILIKLMGKVARKRNKKKDWS